MVTPGISLHPEKTIRLVGCIHPKKSTCCLIRVVWIPSKNPPCWKLEIQPNGACQRTLPETNSSHLKNRGWNMIISFWGLAYFQGLLLSVSGSVTFLFTINEVFSPFDSSQSWICWSTNETVNNQRSMTQLSGWSDFATNKWFDSPKSLRQGFKLCKYTPENKRLKPPQNDGPWKR